MSIEFKVKKTTKRIITLEEHFATPAFIDGQETHLKQIPGAAQLIEKILDLGDIRIADMDAAGIDVQVLSLTAPGVEQMDPDVALPFARETNDILADAVKRHPDRFAGFASLPTSAPDKAADELERMVRKHGFVGAVINGHSKGRYLDDESFRPVLEVAEALQAPIYLHPTRPPRQIVETYYTGNFAEGVTESLATAGWGWHIETAVHALRLILSGAFDRHPRLQILIGHLGEALPFMLPRMDRTLNMSITKLQRPISAYLRENMSYTVSGFNFVPSFLNLMLEIGVSRMMFSIDYPYGSMTEGVAFLEKLPLSPADREKIAHENAETMMGL